MTTRIATGHVIPAKAEILKRDIILHLEPILSNTQATELDILGFGQVCCKIKYDGFTWTPLFRDVVFAIFCGLLFV